MLLSPDYVFCLAAGREQSDYIRKGEVQTYVSHCSPHTNQIQSLVSIFKLCYFGEFFTEFFTWDG